MSGKVMFLVIGRLYQDEERHERMNLLKECDDLNKLEEMGTFQKARVKWDIEGDENSKIFHGILKHKTHQQMVKGIMINGEWVTNPQQVKMAFLNFCKEKFDDHASTMNFSPATPQSRLNEAESSALECGVTMDEEIFKYDIEAVSFFVSYVMPKDSNSSFITLISKVANPIHIKDFRPISLIGVQYKIIAKILANRLAKVVDKVVSLEQSAFILGRQIRDGPLISSEETPIPYTQSLIERFYGKLSPLKAFLLLIEESIRASFFRGGEGFRDRKKMAWVKWGNVMASLDKGGLRVGSLKAFNLALLQKLRWRLVNNLDVLWAYVIKAIHGIDAGNGSLHLRYNRLFHLDSNPNCIIRDMIGDGTWSWNWIRQRLEGRNEEALLSMVAEIGNVSLSNQLDSWHWSINPDGIFTVNITRNHIDDFLLPLSSPSTRWSMFLPRKGLEIPTITCPTCNARVESNDHIFFRCDTATVLWRLIRVWVDVGMPMFSSCSEWFQWAEDWRASKESKDHVYVITATTL
nr:RNA-directed DNA polymerase, eukaryota, reverse transcriptase zinc-binding domain protein [Tanacetum cinerariifolium]